MQIKLDQPVSDPASPRDISNGDTAANLSSHIQTLRSEVVRLKNLLSIHQQERKSSSLAFLLISDVRLCLLDTEKMQRYATEERNIREENLRLQRKLQLEMDRREALCRHLSESESSLEMEEERHYNEAIIGGVAGGSSAAAPPGVRPRRVSSPVPYPSPSSSRPLSPGRDRY